MDVTPKPKKLTPEQEKFQAGLRKLKEIYEDGTAKINDTEYKFSVMMHVRRQKVFAFYSSIQDALQKGNYSFLGTPEYAEVLKILEGSVLVDGVKIDQIQDHWEPDNNAQDYLPFITVAMGVISYPFLAGRLID